MDSDGYSSEGGAQLSIAGTLTDTGQLVVGQGTGGLSAASMVSVGGLAGTGSVALHGSAATANPFQAELDVLSAAPGR